MAVTYCVVMTQYVISSSLGMHGVELLLAWKSVLLKEVGMYYQSH